MRLFWAFLLQSEGARTLIKWRGQGCLCGTALSLLYIYHTNLLYYSSTFHEIPSQRLYTRLFPPHRLTQIVAIRRCLELPLRRISISAETRPHCFFHYLVPVLARRRVHGQASTLSGTRDMLPVSSLSPLECFRTRKAAQRGLAGSTSDPQAQPMAVGSYRRRVCPPPWRTPVHMHGSFLYLIWPRSGRGGVIFRSSTCGCAIRLCVVRRVVVCAILCVRAAAQ